MPATVGNTTGDVLDNLKELMINYMKHEGKQNKAWSKVDLKKSILNWPMMFRLSLKKMII
jgi:hypothetical protein